MILLCCLFVLAAAATQEKIKLHYMAICTGGKRHYVYRMNGQLLISLKQNLMPSAIFIA